MVLTVPNASSLLDTLETSEPESLPSSYRDFRIALNPLKYAAVEQLYYCVDGLNDSTYVRRLQDCRSFSWFARHADTGKVRVISSSCRLRWCPMCSAAKKGWLTGQVAGWLKIVAEPKFLTLTLKHSDAPLDHQVNWLYKYFIKLRREKFWKKFVRGGVWFFQVKRGKKSGQWHPHLHILLDSDYMQQTSLSWLWDQITKGSKIVDIRPVKNVETTVDYVARYATAPAAMEDLEVDDRIETFHALHGRRIVGCFGTAKVIKLTQPKAEDREKWIHVGGWACVTQTANKHCASKLILEAWKNDTVLDKSITMNADDLINGYAKLPKPSVDSFQYKFDFYKIAPP